MKLADTLLKSWEVMRIICETTTDFTDLLSLPSSVSFSFSFSHATHLRRVRLTYVSTQFRVNKPTFCSPVGKESGVSRFESRITESTEDPLDHKKARDQDGWMKYNVFQRVSIWKSTGIIQTFMTRKTVISQQ